jgi:cobalt-zinc-cadmium resistance protein CzcA
MLVTLFLTRNLMPVLYGFFPGLPGQRPNTNNYTLLEEGSHYADEILGQSEGLDRRSTRRET